MLAIEPVVADTFLLPMRRVIGAIQIQQDTGRRSLAAALANVAVSQDGGERFGGLAVDGVLQAREGRLAGKVGAAFGQAPADQLEQGVGAERLGVVLVSVAAGDLVDALADKVDERMADATRRPPIGDAAGAGGTQVEGGISLRPPGQAAIAGQPARIKGCIERPADRRGEAQGWVGRLRHRRTVRLGCGNSEYPAGASVCLAPTRVS